MGEGGEVAGSIVAMQKQSNTNWSHSRGTAGAHRELPTGWSENQRGCKLTGEMSEDERHRKGFGWDSDVENRMKKKNREKKEKKPGEEAATCEFPPYPCNYGKSMHINI